MKPKTISFFFTLLIVSLFLLGCKDSKKEVIPNRPEEKVKTAVNYVEFQKKLELKSDSEKQKYFFRYINNDVPYYWQGTPWTFNGTTNTPQKGSIACGYFVTNVLMNYGFKIKGNYLA